MLSYIILQKVNSILEGNFVEANVLRMKQNISMVKAETWKHVIYMSDGQNSIPG